MGLYREGDLQNPLKMKIRAGYQFSRTEFKKVAFLGYNVLAEILLLGASCSRGGPLNPWDIGESTFLCHCYMPSSCL